jgi:hypothetical protein
VKIFGRSIFLERKERESQESIEVLESKSIKNITPSSKFKVINYLKEICVYLGKHPHLYN